MDKETLASLTHEEKDALIQALFDRVAALEARLGGRGGTPPKTPANSSVPPSRGQKAAKPARPKKPRRKRDSPGVTRALTPDPDYVKDCYASCCSHCGEAAPSGQTPRQVYDHITLPPIRPVVTRVRLFGARCRGCRRRIKAAPPHDMPPGSPFGPSVLSRLVYLHHHHAIGYQRLAAMMPELFGLSISEGAIANALRRGSVKAENQEQKILSEIRKAPVIGCDETGARVTTVETGTRTAWEWVWVTDKAVLHRIVPSRQNALGTGGLRNRSGWTSARGLDLRSLGGPAGSCRDSSGLFGPCPA
jgi:transposase